MPWYIVKLYDDLALVASSHTRPTADNNGVCRVSVHPLSGKSVHLSLQSVSFLQSYFPFATPNCHRELTLAGTLEIKEKVRSNAYDLLAFHCKVCRSSRLVGSYFE